jgi:HSP20 family protein
MLTGRSLNSTLDRMFTLNRVLDDVITGSMNGTSEGRSWVPATDVVERADAYLITLDLPGVDPDSIEVTFEHSLLKVRGTKPRGFDADAKSLRIFSAGRVTGGFERSMRLPEFVDGENIVAELRHGVLSLTVPKLQAALPRRINVKVDQATKTQG